MAINSLSSSSKGLSGLASGMDTQQMVDSLLAGTKGKIDENKQKKTQLTYKQDIYREMASKLAGFRDSFFSFTGGGNTNLLSNTFYNTMKASAASKAFGVTAGAGANTGKTKVDYIKQLAQAEKAQSLQKASGSLGGSLDATKLAELAKNLDQEIKITVDGKTAAVKLKDLIGTDVTVKGGFEMEKVLNDAVKAKLGSDVSVTYTNGKMNVTSTSGKEITVNGDAEALKMFGLSGELKSSTGSASMSLNTAAVLPSFKANVNGVTKNISLNPLTASGTADAATVAARLQESMQKAFGSKVRVTNDNGKLSFSMKNADGTDDATSQITLSNLDSGPSLLGVLGVASGQSNKLNTSASLKNAGFANAVFGGQQRFTINGVDFTFDSDTSISNVINTINGSDAGVKISYVSTEDKFVIESKTAGTKNGDAFTMTQTEGNLLTSMFGVTGSNTFSSSTLKPIASKTGTEVALTATDFANKTTVNLNINGTAYAFDVEFDATEERSMKTFLTKLNKAVEANADTKGKVSFQYSEADGKQTVKMTAADSAKVTVSSGLGFTGVANGTIANAGKANGSMTLGELGLENTKIEFTAGGRTYTVTGSAGQTVDQFAAELNRQMQTAAPGSSASFDENTGRYRMFGVEIPMTFTVSGDEGKLFGTNSSVTIGAQTGTTVDNALKQTQEGKNAVLSINGVEIERSTNEFTVDGLSFVLKDVMAAGGTDGTIDIARNTDQIYDGITKFVEEYNKMVDSINEQLDAKAEYKEYPPLTADEKAAMSDREIELWEEKAKTGLLRNDSALQGVISGLRGTLYTKPEGALALYELGIETTSSLSGGKKDNLRISSPEKLRQMIEENPEALQKLFTDTEKGLGTQLKKAIDGAVNTGVGKKGTLVLQAGSKGSVDTSSAIYRQMKDLDDRLVRLNNTYDKEYSRYWKQFSNMEQMIQQMNSQSSWLSQQFA